VTLGNDTVISNSMKDNPHMHYYAGIYALSMAVMLILKAVRGVVFVKVCANAVVFLISRSSYFCILLSLCFFWSPPKRDFWARGSQITDCEVSRSHLLGLHHAFGETSAQINSFLPL